MKDNFYKAFEDRYRGSRELIRSRLETYRDFLEPLARFFERPQAVDLGCGRGEFLEVLQSAGFQAHGVDMDEGMMQPCRQLGLSVEQREAVDFLRKLPAESQVVVSAFHLVEHLPFDHLRHLVSEALRVLKPGGLMILETPNPENLKVSTHNFYYDPTHKSPIPPGLLAFVAEHEGFGRVKILRLQESVSLNKQADVTMADILEGVSPDYSIVAQKGEAPEIAEALNGAFEKKYGVNMPELVAHFDEGLRKKNQDLKSQQEAVEKSVGEVKKEIVAEIHSLIANLVEQGEKNRLEVSARIDSVKDHMEGRIVEVAQYATQIQDAVLAPSSYLILAPFSWCSYLYKMLKIKKPNWMNKEKRSVVAPKRPRFWRRLKRSISKRRKIMAAAWDFDPAWYLTEYSEVSQAGVEPLSHYINIGKQEGRHKNKSHEGMGTALIRMVKTLRKNSLTTAPRIILEQAESAFWVVTLKKTSTPLEGLVRITARNRRDEVRLSEGSENKKDHRILLKLALGRQKISISFEDKYRIQKTVATKVTKVSNAKKSKADEIVSQKYDTFVDLSAKQATATVWRRLEKKLRNIRKAIFPNLLLTIQQQALRESGDIPAVALTLNQQANDIFQEIRMIHK